MGAPHAVLSRLVFLSLLCQQCFCPVRPLQPAPAHLGMGDGARRIHNLQGQAGTGRGSEMLLLYLCHTLCLLQVFSREELGLIAELCVKHDVLCISDEVYEWLVYDGKQHIRIGTGQGQAGAGGLLRAGNGDFTGIPWKSQGLPACTAVLGMNPHWKYFVALQSQPPNQVLNRSPDFRASQRGDLEQKASWLQRNGFFSHAL